MAKKKTDIPADCMPMCATCVFGDLSGEGGTCHRYPPIYAADEDGAGFTFTIVAADDWCGEYKRKVN
jgi:hypothetical protein